MNEPQNTSEPQGEPHTCRHCGTTEEPYWSRIIPMGYFCSKCGGAWTENDGVDHFPNK